MPLVFVDTNVLLYAFDDRDPAKQRRARQWLEACWLRRCGRVSTQVLNGSVADRLAEAAAPIGGRHPILVLGRRSLHSHTGTPGATAYRVAASARVPLLMHRERPA